MASLTIIIPVHNVDAYLRGCLASVLDDGGLDIEVIAVDDCSTDRSPEILAEFAGRDARLTVLRPPTNQGLGRARNLGLDAATSDYVMFLDSDDELLPGAIESITDQLDRHEPDVLVFDYQRLYWNNRTARNVMSPLLADRPAPITLDDEPDLLRLLNVAWNKAYRREFIDDLGLRFPPGYYEDIPWTYVVLPAARSISLLDEVCLNYRQRRAGSILRSASARHFEMIDQVDRVLGDLEHRPELERWLGPVWDRCASHVLTVLAHGESRLPNDLREDFFVHAGRVLRHHLPPGHEIEGGLRGAQVELLVAEEYRLFSIMKTANRARSTSLKRARSYRKKIRAQRQRATRKVRDLEYAVRHRLPVDDHLAVYTCLWNRAPSGNPWAIYEEQQRIAAHIRGVWIVRAGQEDRVPEGVETVRPSTREYYDLLARAKYFVNDVNFPDFVDKRPGQRHLQTQHGTPLKYMGLDLQLSPDGKHSMNFSKLMRRVDRWDFNLSSNRFSTEVWRRAFPSRYEMLEYGYPRNDCLVNATAEDVAAARAELGVQPDEFVVLYAPTHREGNQGLELGLDVPAFMKAAPEGTRLLLRGHYFYGRAAEADELELLDRVTDVGDHPRIEDLYLASDLLLTDYSSAMFDYANLSRPIVIFAYDWDEYRASRGTYFDITVDRPGPIAMTMDELVHVMAERRWERTDEREALDRFARIFCEFDDGRAAERTVRRFFLDEDVEAPTAGGPTVESIRSWNRRRAG